MWWYIVFMKSQKIEPKFEKNQNPRIGLIALATDLVIEKDFISVIKDKKIDFFVNRIECYNPLSKENLIKMSENITQVTKDILPEQKLDCVVYACTSGTVSYTHLTLPTTPYVQISVVAVSLKKLNIKKLSIFTPYSKKVNDDVIDYFKSSGFEITSNSYIDIHSDMEIGKVDQNYLFDVLINLDVSEADALFVSCTALPVLPLIQKLEDRLKIPVLSSNQALIWESLENIGENKSVKGFGRLFD